jgi:hypothetical protein
MYLHQQHHQIHNTKLCHNLPNLYKTGNFSDITLQFFHNSGLGPTPLESLPILEVKTHRNILSACNSEILNQFVNNRYREGVRVELNFECFSKEVVHFFFSLLYHNKLTPHLLSKNYENITQIHQLAIYFQFQALVDLCHAILYNLFSLEHLPVLVDYCHPTPNANVSYDKCPLYTKLVRWDQLCNNPTLMGEREEVGFHLPGRSIMVEGGVVRLYHYRHMCLSCISGNKLMIGGNVCIIDMGFLESLDGYRWNFSMTRRKSDPSSVYLYIKELAPPVVVGTEDNMSVETTHIESKVSLFSKLINDEVVSTQCEADTLSSVTQIAHLQLHDLNYCYESQCDSCKTYAATFIFCITVCILK